VSDLNETPGGNRIRIAFFGLRNAGKSTLVNAFTGQPLAIVCATPGTTTDPVSKSMEILPLGPCTVIDTAGLDDEGELGAMRVRKTLDVLATTDVAVWVSGDDLSTNFTNWHERFLSECAKRGVVAVEYRRGESVEDLKRKIASIRLTEETPGLLDGLVGTDDSVICVCPIDESAPKGRLILPQVQVIRSCLDLHVVCTVVQPAELSSALARFEKSARLLVITDSQAFGEVSQTISQANDPGIRLTSFSVLFARQKGDAAEFLRGVEAVARLKDGDTVLIAEGCTHHRQCNDIGSVKIPKALTRMSGRKLNFTFASGTGFDVTSRPALIVHCGGCMLTRREVLRRISMAKDAGLPIVNYGMLLAAAAGVGLRDLAGL